MWSLAGPCFNYVTKEDLITECKLKVGPALQLVSLVEELKKVKGLVESGK